MKPRLSAGFFLLPLFVLFNFGCTTKPAPETSFYHWKSSYNPSAFERRALEQSHVSRLYVKYFDVVKEESIKPVSVIKFRTVPKQEIVPVIFIRNNVFSNITAIEIDTLVKHVLKLITEINSTLNIKPAEFQFDCDWTETTRDNYFHFLSQLRRQCSEVISATIRLHQVKYKKQTGIPPVHRGVLMYYNIGKISADSLNSIYQREYAKKYIAYLKEYPLHLDLALPIFSWGIQSRDGQVVQLLNKMNESDFISDSAFRHENNFRFTTVKANFKSGYYFQEGDKIKIEKIPQSLLFEMAADLSDNLNFAPSRIIYYDLDSVSLKPYDEKIFKKIGGYFN